MLGLLSYFVGLGLILFLVAHFGRSIIARFRFFANPNGIFRKLLGVIIFLVGALIVTGWMKTLEAYIVEKGFFVNAYSLEEKINQNLIPPEPMMCSG